MKRRGFLLGMLALPAAPALALLPKAPETLLYGGAQCGAMANALLAAAERVINPPFFFTATMAKQYRDEYIANFEARSAILREVVKP